MEHKKRMTILTIFGLILFIIGFFLFIFISPFISMVLNKKLALIPANPGFALWRDMDIPIYQNFYLFNITNPDEMSNGAKPILKEIGPFVYKVNISKIDLNFTENNDQITFYEIKSFHFQPNETKIDINTKITALNVPLITVYEMIDTQLTPSLRPLAKWALKELLKPSFFITGTAEELLFKGLYNKILNFANKLFPNKVKSPYFSFMQGQNNSQTGPYLIYSGYNDIRLIDSLITYQGENKLDLWDGDLCNDIDGKNIGETFAPAGKSGSIKSYTFFRPDFCRSFNLTLNETNVLSDVNNLPTDRFHMDPRSLLNATQYPPNSCYRPKRLNQSQPQEQENHENFLKNLLQFLNVSNSELLLKNLTKASPADDSYSIYHREMPSGVFDVSPCAQDAPLYLSYPHFFDADSYYLQDIIGLNPNESKHQSYIDIEPQTGVPVDFIARVQANADLQTKYTLKPQMKSLLLPLFWQEFSIHITKEIAEQIESQTKSARVYYLTFSSLIFVIGLIMLLYVLIVFAIHFVNKRRYGDDNDNETEHLVTESSAETS